MGLTQDQRKRLEYEVISNDVRLRFTRLIRHAVGVDDQDVVIVRQNAVINIARNVLHLPIFIIRADDMGNYHVAEHAWHRGEIEILFRRPNTAQLVETLADLIEQHWLDIDEVNEIFIDDSAAISFEDVGIENEVQVLVPTIEEIESDEDDQHPNIRVLVNRMESALDNRDPSAVLHTSASIFETLAKDVVRDPNVEDRSLGQFFDRYAAESNLPDKILEYIKGIFRRRNREPLAGHGNIREPEITEDEATILANLTKAIVRIERQLALTVAENEAYDEE